MVIMEVETDALLINRDKILTHLMNNDEIIFKQQQRGEADLTKDEKFQIAADIFEKNKVTFLTRFGKYLDEDHLKFFTLFENEDLNIIIRDLLNDYSKKGHHLLVRNRRYEALNRLKQNSTYFSEIEMMKRNPLLYEQLIGQYLSEDEKRERDKISTGETSFVKILMEGIERDESEAKRIKQEEEEDNAMEEEDDDEDEEGVLVQKSEDKEDTQPYVQWGEIKEYKSKMKKTEVPSITATERKLLREEFITTMYESFLDGKDSDFDYKKVDNDQQYDNIAILSNDAEEKYFDAESPEDVEMQTTVREESEDELDTYMKRIHHKLEMSQIAQDLKKL